MTGTSLVFILMPIIVPIGLAVLVALPFLAASNPSRAIASGVPAEPKTFPSPSSAIPGRPPAGTQPPPANQASPDPA